MFCIRMAFDLLDLCQTVPYQLKLISNSDFKAKPRHDKWSKKELLGHLIDSAAANHQRFVRAQFEKLPVIYYEQDVYVLVQNFQQEDTELLISLWEIYNRHLAHVIANISEDKLQNECVYKDGSTADLKYIIEDYISHLHHHLNQLIEI